MTAGRALVGSGVVLGLGIAIACARATTGSTSPREERGSAIVLTASDLGSGGTALLEALERRIPQMRVQRTGVRCPRINLRGQRSITTSSNPRLYVDGTLMGDTCILNQLSVGDVERVEIYPGATSTPGYESNPNGMILVFRFRGR